MEIFKKLITYGIFTKLTLAYVCAVCIYTCFSRCVNGGVHVYLCVHAFGDQMLALGCFPQPLSTFSFETKFSR